MLPASFHEPFETTASGTAGATIQVYDTPTNGTQYWVNKLIVSITTAGAAGTSIHFRSKAAAGQKTIHKLTSAATGFFVLDFGERGFQLPRNHGIEFITAASVVCEVSVTGYITKP